MVLQEPSIGKALLYGSLLGCLDPTLTLTALFAASGDKPEPAAAAPAGTGPMGSRRASGSAPVASPPGPLPWVAEASARSSSSGGAAKKAVEKGAFD